MYGIIRLSTYLKNFVPEIVPLRLKNREKNQNQRIHTGGLMYGGPIREGLGEGAYRRRNTVFVNIWVCEIYNHGVYEKPRTPQDFLISNMQSQP